MTIKLLALDLDGTLFGDDLLISRRTRAAIRSAQEMGVLVTIATGRMFRSARQVAGDLLIHAPLICYQGAMIRHSVTGEMLLNKTVPNSLAHEIIDETRRRNLHLNLYMNDRLYVDHLTPEAQFYAQINLDLEVHEVGNLNSWLDMQGGQEVTKMVIVTAPELTDRVLEEFTEQFGGSLQVTKSHPRFTEFTNAGCTKGVALAFLAGYLHIEQVEVMAIGDGHNDLDMIEWAGYGIAMPSAPEAVRAVARSVGLPIADDGAAEAIERYILA